MAQLPKGIWIPARDLQITNGDDPNKWIWTILPPPSNLEFATLVCDTVLNIVGKPSDLPPKSVASLVFKLELEKRKNIDELYGYYGPSGTGNPGTIVSLITDATVIDDGGLLDGWSQVVLGYDSTNPEAGVGATLVGGVHARLSGLNDGGKPKSGLVVAGILIQELIGN